MTEARPTGDAAPDTWSDFLEGTADRPPLPFFEQAMEFVDGKDGHGRLAADVGCGGGAETRALLERGWRVFATDASPSAERLIRDRVDPAHRDRLTVAIGSFETIELPESDLVFAQMSLPFAGSNLDVVTEKTLGAVRTGGAFAGHFFGHNDDWIDGTRVAAVDRSWLARSFADFDEVVIAETDREGPFGLAGELKHWHFYFVLAQR